MNLRTVSPPKVIYPLDHCTSLASARPFFLKAKTIDCLAYLMRSPVMKLALRVTVFPRQCRCKMLVKTNAGERAFNSCNPSPWNNLPLSVRPATSVATFRKCLTTHFFDLVFPPKTLALPMARLLTYKALREKQPVHLHSMLSASIPLLRSTMIIVCQSLGSRPILVLELLTLVPRLFGTTSRCLSVQPFQLVRSRNI